MLDSAKKILLARECDEYNYYDYTISRCLSTRLCYGYQRGSGGGMCITVAVYIALIRNSNIVNIIIIGNCTAKIEWLF